MISSCTNPAKPDSVYCSEQCIVKHADESLVALEQGKQMRFGSTKVVCKYIVTIVLVDESDCVHMCVCNLQNVTLVTESAEQNWLDYFCQTDSDHTSYITGKLDVGWCSQILL